MRIYKASVHHAQDGWTISYHPKHRDAYQEVQSAMRLDKENTNGHVTEIEFSLTKYGVINLLNNRTPHRDNG